MTDSALGCLGVDLDNTYASAGELPIDQGVEIATRNGRAVLAIASGNIPAGSVSKIAPSSATASVSVVAVVASLTNVYGGLLAIPQVDVSTTRYGWFHTACNKEGKVLGASGVAPTGDEHMYAGANGTVDDGTASAQLLGIEVLATATSGVTLVPAIWNNIQANDTA